MSPQVHRTVVPLEWCELPLYKARHQSKFTAILHAYVMNQAHFIDFDIIVPWNLTEMVPVIGMEGKVCRARLVTHGIT